MKYEVYYIQCLKNGKGYVGITRNGVKNRILKGHFQNNSGAPMLKKAIKKYGKEAFIFQVIDTAQNVLNASEKEIFYIKKLNTLSPNGYNMLKGGYTNEIAAAANNEPIRCVNTGEIFESIKKASEELGVPAYSISFACVGRQDFAKKLKFEYVSEEKRNKANELRAKRKEKKELKYKKIRRIKDGKVYNNLHEAAKDSGADRNCIALVCKGKMDFANGERFEYMNSDLRKEAENKAKKRKEDKNKLNKLIQCIENGKIYSSAAEAAKDLSTHPTSVREVARGEKDTSSGYSFVYVDKKLKEKAEERKKLRKLYVNTIVKEKRSIRSKQRFSKQVKCNETGKIYNSMTEAAEDLKIDKNTVSRSVSAGKKLRSKYSFVLIKKGE